MLEKLLLEIKEKLFHTLFGAFSRRRIFKKINPDCFLWDNMPIKENSVLLWDLENIPFNRLDDIKNIAKYTPESLYVITKLSISDKNRIKIEKEGFKILDAHNTISDDKIISMMKFYMNKPNIMLISADSDFAKTANQYIKKNILHWILTDSNKKAVIMNVNLASPNLTISTLKRRPKINYHLYKNSKKRQASLGNKGKFFTNHKEFLKDTKITPDSNIVYRYDFKGRKRSCGKVLTFSQEKNSLSLNRNIFKKYSMPKYDHVELFQNISDVKHLIHFDNHKHEFWLRDFKHKQRRENDNRRTA